jgi:quinohemoprotein ethanol dehydrogenase
MNLGAPDGLFAHVNGVVSAILTVPDGWKLDQGPVGSSVLGIGPVTITTPLSTQTFNAVSAVQSGNGKTLVATFNKSDIDNNVPAGDSVPLTVSANFLDTSGVQHKLQGTANVRVLK